MTDLPQIPPAQRQRLGFDEPQFVSYDGEWMLIGPDTALPVGQKVKVRRRKGGPTTVTVAEYVAEYVVRRQPGGYLHETGPAEVRYVIARIATTKGDQRG